MKKFPYPKKNIDFHANPLFVKWSTWTSRDILMISTFILSIRHSSEEWSKPTSDIPLYWLVNGDPVIGLLQSLYKWGGFHIPQPTKGFFIAQVITLKCVDLDRSLPPRFGFCLTLWCPTELQWFPTGTWNHSGWSTYPVVPVKGGKPSHLKLDQPYLGE